MLSLEGRDLLAGDRAAITIRRVLGHLEQASIISTGQALTQATSQALEGDERTCCSQVFSAEGGPPAGPKSGRTDGSQEAHSISFSFLI